MNQFIPIKLMEKEHRQIGKTFDLSLLESAGDDVFISESVEIRRPALVRVGSHVAIDSGFYMTTAARIGDYVHISPYTTVVGGVNGMLRMGNFTNISAGGRIICGSDGFLGEGLVTAPGIPDAYRDALKIEPIIFEDFANVGTNSVIMPGVTLAEGSVVGACSLVTKSTEPWTVYVGIPAKPLKVRPKEKMLEYARELGYRQ